MGVKVLRISIVAGERSVNIRLLEYGAGRDLVALAMEDLFLNMIKMYPRQDIPWTVSGKMAKLNNSVGPIDSEIACV